MLASMTHTEISISDVGRCSLSVSSFLCSRSHSTPSHCNEAKLHLGLPLVMFEIQSIRPASSVVLGDKVDGDSTVVSTITPFSNSTASSSGDFPSSSPIFSVTTLYGRDQERKALSDALSSVVYKPSKVVYVSGPSGSGKSSLVESFRVPASDRGAFFVAAKYDQIRQPEPFSEIVTSLSDLCDLIVQSESVDEIRDTVRENMTHDEIQALLPLISNLHDMVGIDMDLQEQEELYSWRQSFARFKILCRKFLHSVATATHPVVWFLDDLQWADPTSIAVIESLVMDTDSRNVLLVLAYRNDAEEISQDFQTFLDATVARPRSADDAEKEILDSLELHIGSLDVEQVNELVAERFQKPLEETKELSVLVRAKTLGNAFCVLEFLDMLQAEELVTVDQTGDNFQWDLAKIQSETNVSDNVVVLLLNKIQRLPVAVQRILKIASCLSFSFEFDLLYEVIMDQATTDPNLKLKSSRAAAGKRELTVLLSVASKVGLIEMIQGGESVKFAHDKVRSSLYTSIGTPEEVQQIHLRIGKLVAGKFNSLKDQSSNERDKLLFLATDQLTLGASLIDDPINRLHLATLCLAAGKASISSKNAYAAAARYLQNAVRQLPEGEEAWDDQHYELTLEIHTHLAKAESGAAFIFHDWEKVIETILENAKSLNDRLPVYEIAMEAHIVQGDFMGAMEIGRQVMREMGEPFPAKEAGIGQVLVELSRTKKDLKKLTDDMIRELPAATDDKVIVTIKTMHDIGRSAFYVNQPKTMIFCYCRALRLTIKHGFTVKTPSLIAKQGMIQTLLGNHDLSFRYGQLAMELLERPMVGQNQEAETIVYTHMFTAHWKQPSKDFVPVFKRGYASGMRTGEVAFALVNALSVASASFSSGESLHDCEGMFREVCKMAREYKVGNVLDLGLPLWQGALNMMFETEHPLVLSGEAMKQHEMLDNNPSPICQHQILTMQVLVAFIFAEWEYLRETIPRMEKIRKTVRGVQALVFTWEYTCMAGVTYFALQRTCSNPFRFRPRAKKALRKLKKAVDSAITDCRPFYQLLLAEECALAKPSLETIKDAYDSAIAAATDTGLQHYVAVGYERAGRTFFELEDYSLAAEYLRKARDAFLPWGAEAKCDQLDNLRHKLRLYDLA